MAVSTGQRSRTLLVLMVAAPLALALLLWLSVSDPGGDTSPAGGGSDPRVGLTIYTGDDRAALPALTGQDLNGQPLDAADYAGQAMVLNVWGSWCGPCRAEAPDLVAVAADYPAVQFLGIDTRDNPSSANAFVRNFDISYPSWDDQDGAVLGKLSGLVPISAVPSTLVIDESGDIAARVIGQVDEATLRGLIDDVTSAEENKP